MWLILVVYVILFVAILGMRGLGAALIARLPASHSPPALNAKLGERVLVLTAHPDDESMFFGPTILTLYDLFPQFRT